MHGKEIRPQFDGLAVRRERAVRLSLRHRQIALEDPPLGELRVLGQRCIDRCESAGDVAAGRLLPRHAKDRRRIIGLCRQSRLECGFPRLGVSHGEIGLPQRGLQFGGALRRANGSAAEFVDSLLELAPGHHDADQRRHDLVGRVLELERLPQLLLGGREITRIEQRPAQQEPGLGQIGLFLQRASELDHRGLLVALGQILLRGLDQSFGFLGARREQRHRQRQKQSTHDRISGIHAAPRLPAIRRLRQSGTMPMQYSCRRIISQSSRVLKSRPMRATAANAYPLRHHLRARHRCQSPAPQPCRWAA